MVPVNMGSVSDVDFDHGGHFKFKVTFEVEPQIKLPRMKRTFLKLKRQYMFVMMRISTLQ